MIIKKDISKNRVIDSSYDDLTSSSPIITRYLWKFNTNEKSLLLLADEGNGRSFSIKLDGEVFLEFGMKRCLTCGQIIPRTSYQAICKTCEDSLQYKCRRCLFEGPGVPFNTKCTPENSPCNLAYMNTKCWSDHYIYFGRFGNKIKVGTSNCKRSEGEYYRLFEQGLDEALVIKSFQSLEEVLIVEAKLAEMFGLTTYLTFVDKVNLLMESSEANDNSNLQFYLPQLKELFSDKKLDIIDLSDLWVDLPAKYHIVKSSFPHKIEGTIIASRGNVLFVEPFQKNSSKDILYAFNLSQLSGYELIVPEDY